MVGVIRISFMISVYFEPISLQLFIKFKLLLFLIVNLWVVVCMIRGGYYVCVLFFF